MNYKIILKKNKNLILAEHNLFFLLDLTQIKKWIMNK